MTYTLTNSENDENHVNPDARLIHGILASLPQDGFAILVNDTTQDFAQIYNPSPLGSQRLFHAEYMTTDAQGRRASWQHILDDSLSVDDAVAFFEEYMEGSGRHEQRPHSSERYMKRSSSFERLIIALAAGILFFVVIGLAYI